MADPVGDIIGDYRGFAAMQHQRVYRMGLEHLGVVVGEDVDAFSREHRAALTGQQFQNADNEPYYTLFEDFTHVKFHRRSLYDVCVLEGASFDGFVHVDDWVPQRLVGATGPKPLLTQAASGTIHSWSRSPPSPLP